MKAFLPLRRLAGLTALTLTFCATATATDILNITTALSLSDPIQLGRLARNNTTPQDWANTETFPGITTITTPYHYHSFLIDASTVALGPFIQISLDHLGPNQGTLFASAYTTSYNPNSVNTGNLGFDINWLGDAGFSGNFFGTDPVFFQVKVPVGLSLVVVVNNTAAANLGVGDPFNLAVESFSNSLYSPALATPDSGASALLLSIGLVSLGLVQRKIRQQTLSQRR